jgi:hypothetical protein
MRTVEETDINACIPDLFCESLLNLWVRIANILQISKDRETVRVSWMRYGETDMIGISENSVFAFRASSRRDMANPCGQLVRIATRLRLRLGTFNVS